MEQKAHLTGTPLIVAAVALSLATFMFVLDYSIANVAIPYIAGDLAVSNDEGTYVITSFAVGNAIMLPMTGWLTKRIGAVKLMALSAALFTIFSVVCGFSVSLPMLVISRFIQGLVAGPMIPLSQSLILSIFPPEKKNRALALWGSVVIAAPIFGPVVGGWITYNYSWPWIFFINLPIGILSVIPILLLLKPFETPTQRVRTDFVGLILLAIGVSCLQILLDKGQQWDWWNSERIRVLSITSFVSFAFLIGWELTDRQPLLELKLFKIPTYTLSVLFIAVTYALYFGTVVLIPFWLQVNMGYTATWAGLAVAPMGIIPFICSPLVGRMLEKMGPIRLLFICFILFAGSSFLTAYMDTDIDFYHVALGRFLFGSALLFMITPILALSGQGIPIQNLPSATGLFHFARSMMGAVGTSVFTTIWQRRTIFQHSNVVTPVDSTSENLSLYMGQLNELGIKGKEALAVTNVMADNQASMLALNECFFLMGWIVLGLLLFLPLGRKRKAIST